jgi:hypothetical protein
MTGVPGSSAVLLSIYQTTQNNIPEYSNINIIMGLKNTDWIPWALYSDPWQDIMNTVMNLWIP